MGDFHFILGAPDPEMDEIENAIRKAGCSFEYARVRAARVHPGNAYRADDQGDVCPPTITPVLVECGFAAGEWRDFIHVDHHRPGDPGFGKGPEHFLEASSLGQVLKLLGVEPDTVQRMVAAADHCLGAAYHGLCPGIDPLSLRQWRTTHRAKFQRRSPASVRADQNAAIVAVRDARIVRVADHDFADLRGQSVPELPEASAITGRGVMYSIADKRSGRTKIGVLNGTVDGLAAWLEWARSPASGLRDAYGDPVRGFAGAYAD